ncbi:MAG: DHH family phosphoesterase [Desulfobacteraceae bacterium]|nr:DHH family phosphoesterase [Desulfobacteraceae bacterium]
MNSSFTIWVLLLIGLQYFNLADTDYVNSILRNNIQIDDLKQYRFMLNHMECADRMAFCYFPQGCDQNLLGILGDFLLSLDKIDFVALCAHNKDRINFSLRSEAAEWAADAIARQILQGIGFGGGHAEMAGGVSYSAFIL